MCPRTPPRGFAPWTPTKGEPLESTHFGSERRGGCGKLGLPRAHVRTKPKATTCLSELCDDLDPANDGFVERGKVLRWNPIFEMFPSAGLLDLVAGQEIRPHLKLRDVATSTRSIPIARYLCCLCLCEHRVENRLLGQAGRKRTHIRSRTEFKLRGTNRTPQRYRKPAHRFSLLPSYWI
jgi:hypothetical protein